MATTKSLILSQVLLVTFSSFAFAYSDDTPGFLAGLWDGTVWIAHLIQKLYKEVDVYQNYNTGFGYNLGFFLCLLTLSWTVGVVLSIGVLAWDGVMFLVHTKILGFFLIVFTYFLFGKMLFEFGKGIVRYFRELQQMGSQLVTFDIYNAGFREATVSVYIYLRLFFRGQWGLFKVFIWLAFICSFVYFGVRIYRYHFNEDDYDIDRMYQGIEITVIALALLVNARRSISDQVRAEIQRVLNQQKEKTKAQSNSPESV
jgi:hypothetical protein